MPDTNLNVCLNCGAALSGRFCSDCGQKLIEPNERTVKHFIYQFLGSAFFLENNFLKNMWYLLTHPGKQAIDFIEGRRKRWMPPFSLLLLINLFYFWYSPLSDLNLKLKEQLFQVHHQSWARQWVDRKLESDGTSFEEYERRYNQKSSAYANSLIVLHLPVFALFLTLIFIRKRYFFVDHLIFSNYFLSFILLVSLVQMGLLYVWEHTFPSQVDVIWRWVSALYLLAILTYSFGAIRKTYAVSKRTALITLFPVFISFFLAHMIYRTLLFVIVYCVT